MEEKTKKHLILKDYRETGFERTLNQVQEKPHLPMLPFIHKADSVFDPKRMKPTALDYFAAGFIPAVPCKFFGEKLVYTFIGRPAYRELKTPVCFILKPASELLQFVFYLTGAYHCGKLIMAHFKTAYSLKLAIPLLRGLWSESSVRGRGSLVSRMEQQI